jgi:hypothetical protein
MFVFNALLFPTGSDKMAGLDYLIYADLGVVPRINWCQAVVDDIKDKARDLKENISNNDKSTPNVQGYTTFFVVTFYLLSVIIYSAISYLGQPFHL